MGIWLNDLPAVPPPPRPNASSDQLQARAAFESEIDLHLQLATLLPRHDMVLLIADLGQMGQQRSDAPQLLANAMRSHLRRDQDVLFALREGQVGALMAFGRQRHNDYLARARQAWAKSLPVELGPALSLGHAHLTEVLTERGPWLELADLRLRTDRRARHLAPRSNKGRVPVIDRRRIN